MPVRVLKRLQCATRLITLIEKWKKSVDNGGAFGALFTDLSKAFDRLSHELLIAKLDAYGFDKDALKLVNSSSQIESKELKLITNIVHGVKYYLGWHKVQFQGLYCSTFSYVACFTF